MKKQTIFYQRISELVKSKGTSLTAIVNEIGIAVGQVTAWKNGIHPSGENLKKLAERLGSSTDYLLGHTDDPSPPGDSISLSDFEFAFHREAQDLTEDDKDMLLRMAKQMKERMSEREG
jgi:transcriptional regulator with XRE-family HTH domain